MSQSHPRDVSHGGDSFTLKPLLQEVLAALRQLVAGGEKRLIDLRAMPLAPGDLERLEAFLGRGEVSAVLDALGRSEFVETRYAGVWLVTHFNSDGQVVGRYIEIAPVPELLQPPTDDLYDALSRLDEALQDGNAAPGAAAG